MAVFRPLKRYLIGLIDQMVAEHHLSGPFLDAGCGVGEVALHFAKKGWEGRAIDLSAKAVEEAKVNLASYKKLVSVECNDIFNVRERYKTIFLCNVIEHIEDDRKLIQHLGKNMGVNSRIIISFPVHKEEWRWDDDFYGHIRRYEPLEIEDLLRDCGFEVLEIWDFTFPVFWLLRWLYTRVIPRRLILGGGKESSTMQSALQGAWDREAFASLVEKLTWWRLIFWLQEKFKNRLIGCDCVLIARLKNGRKK